MSFSANECLNQGTFAVTVTKKYYWSHSVGQILTDLNDFLLTVHLLRPFTTYSLEKYALNYITYFRKYTF